MLSLRPNHLAFLFLFHCLFLALSPANAVPIVIKRQSDGQSTTVMTQSTTSTAAGDMTQTCVITLTPITDNNGNAAVREVKTCTLTMGAVNNNGNNGNTNGGNNGTDSGSSTSTDTTGSSSTDTTGSSSTDSAGASATGAAGGGAVSANGVSSVAPASVTGSASVTDSAGASAASASSTASSDSGNGGAAVSAGGVTSVDVTAVSTDSSVPTPAAASAADQQSPSPSSSAFVVPGQKIQVLPIGLGSICWYLRNRFDCGWTCHLRAHEIPQGIPCPETGRVGSRYGLWRDGATLNRLSICLCTISSMIDHIQVDLERSFHWCIRFEHCTDSCSSLAAWIFTVHILFLSHHFGLGPLCADMRS
ncbi:hypothetical protein MVEN_00524600 [Mycena venus]|uniref:Uncharacterized protein n=1 Tax=Mycena venus TaxID=2733690 RepID=A0A8H6YNW5_9AGAR|nr:hypothetical protein MVEN_00524600 [Mycena venus]